MKNKNQIITEVKYECKEANIKIIYLLFGVLLMIDITFLIGYWINAYIITRPIEINGMVECNSGNIGIDYESVYERIFSFYGEEYKQTPKKLDLKGISNLSCKIQFNTKAHISDIIKIMQFQTGKKILQDKVPENKLVP